LRIQEIYRSRLEARRAALAARDRADLNFSRARLAMLFAGAAVLLIGGWTAAAWVALPAAAFFVVLVLHARLLNARDRARAAVAFYERALDRIDGRWSGRGDAGERFRQSDHLFADDLDLFGRGSLFELLSTSRTRAGEEPLAGWLLSPAPPDDVAARQAGARELAGQLDLREAVAVLGDGVGVGVQAAALRRWATAPIRLRGAGVRLLLAALAGGVMLAVAHWGTTGSAMPMLAVLAASAAAAISYRQRVLHVVDAVTEPAHDLDLLADVLRTIERHAFQSPGLRRLHGALGGTARPASAEIARLDQLVALLSSRRNIMFAGPAALLLWATQLAFAIEAWRSRVGPHIPRWLDAIGEFEALSSLATYTAEHPDDAFPEFVAGAATLEATALAHPLLPPGAVRNDASLGGAGPRLLVVSGSNMSGKSTLLRALGINVVLAHAGAPVRATRFRLTPLAVGASLRIQDSLQDGRSKFFAEITRLKQIVDLVRARGGGVLFLLDEILGGTNSHDRRVGAEALLAGLIDLGAIGAVTTHDLALGEIAESLAPRAANVHFEDRFADGALAFDYVLRPGIVRTSNAIPLMRSVGLDV
jgi:hypothetical protein